MSAKRITVIGVAVLSAALTGCTKSQLVRFAPPGIFKYEEIANEKPQNPAIEAVLKERKANSNAVFPVISQTPGRQDRPTPASQKELASQLEDLEAARDALTSAVERDRAEAQADLQSAETLREQRENLTRDIDEQSGIAKRERVAPIKQE